VTEAFVLEATTLMDMSGFSCTFCFGKQDLFDKWEHGVIFGALKNMAIVFSLSVYMSVFSLRSAGRIFMKFGIGGGGGFLNFF